MARHGFPRVVNFHRLALVVGSAVQIPFVLALGALTGQTVAVAAAAGALTVPALGIMRTPWDIRARGRWQTWLALWPFLLWWTICLAFWLWAPPLLLLALGTDLSTRGALAVACGGATLGGAWAMRRRARVVRRTVPMVGLPEAFQGYRIAQISDIHCGRFVSEAQVRRWVERVNGLGADLVTVTGDLITSGDEHVETVARALGGLRAPDGVVVSLGNHDYFGVEGDRFTRILEDQGLVVLRNRARALRRGKATLRIAGVDDTWTKRDDLDRALADGPRDAPTVLLAHDPALFPQAVARGVGLTLSGHTHGGQLAFPLRPRRWNLARFMTRFSSGLYVEGPSTLYVNAGLGTTGPPLRIGARPEIALFTLEPGHDLATS